MTFNKNSLIKLVDLVAFVLFVFAVSTGVLMRYVLPPGSGPAFEVLGMSRHEWSDIHFYITSIFLAVLSVHLVFHWRFIQSLFQGNYKEISVLRVLLGLVGLFAILAIAVAPFVAPKEHTVEPMFLHHGKNKNR